jgi:RHS repeat-associated protein
VMWQWEAEPFGNSLPEQNPQGQGTFVYNLRLPGQVYDTETGLNYNYFRDYDPGTGRYMQADPIGLAGGSMSLYSYADNAPTMKIDPSGLSSIDDAPVMIYGMWCGPNWTGGGFGSFDSKNNGAYRRPVDQLDGCCREHDICYFQCRKTTACETDEQAACFRSCDRTLANCAGKSNGPLAFKTVVGGYMQTSNPKAEQCQCKQ